MLTALGLNPAKENIAPVTGRPVKLSQGKPIRELIAGPLRPDLNASAQPAGVPTEHRSFPTVDAGPPLA